MSRRLISLLLFHYLLFLTGALGAESVAGASSRPVAFPDHSAARLEYLSVLLTAHPSKVLGFPGRAVATPEGRTHISVERRGPDFLISFSSAPSDEPASPGDYLVRRNVATTYLLDISVVLSRGGSDHVLLRPKGQRTLMDVYADGAKVYDSVPLDIPLYHLLARPFRTIVDLAGTKLPWDSLLAGVGAR
jgi:hypothetical protein